MLMEMKRAVCSYKFGAYQGSRKGVLENNLIDQDSVAGSWSHAGVAIRRYIGLAYDESENTALYEAAERCYRWAICLSVKTLTLDNAKDNFMNCLRFKTMKSVTAAGTCNACADNTYGADGASNCLANAVCGKQDYGATRVQVAATRTVVGTCSPCNAGYHRD